MNTTNILNELNILYIFENDILDDGYYKKIKKTVSKFFATNELSEILDIYKEIKPDIIITEINKEIIKNLEEIRSQDFYQPIIVLTEKFEKNYMLKSFELNINNYILKPVDKENLFIKIENVAKRWLIRKKNIQKRVILQSILDNQSGLTILTDFKSISFASKSFLSFYNIKCVDDFFTLYDEVLHMFSINEKYISGKTKEEFLNKYKNSKAIDKVVLLLGKDFQPKAFHVNIDKIRTYNEDDLYLISMTNISIMQEQNIEISYKAYIDNLTGIYNRNKFEEVYNYEYLKFTRVGIKFCIAILDIDHFKKFNDTFGHLIGDEILKIMAKTVNENTRKIDTFARWGGEEFVLLMPATNIDGAKNLCENLRAKIEKIVHPIASKITCSFGITQINESDSLDSLFKRCDEALYNAKANGRNRVEIN
jgi:diguanylate cyclase (GGDEF)-like protein